MNKIIINGQYTFSTNLSLKVGDTVLLPTPSWLIDVQGPTWTGKVTSLTSDYDGYCQKVISKVD
jgi:hypothetical protein